MVETDIFILNETTKIVMCEFEQECLFLLRLIVDVGNESLEESQWWRDD